MQYNLRSYFTIKTDFLFLVSLTVFITLIIVSVDCSSSSNIIENMRRRSVLDDIIEPTTRIVFKSKYRQMNAVKRHHKLNLKNQHFVNSSFKLGKSYIWKFYCETIN